jgi:thiol-disulfide isomerase/thioredoxin
MKKIIIPMLILVGMTTYAQTEIMIGQRVPDTKLQLFNAPNKTVKLSSFLGKALILEFWGTGCAPCIQAFPKLDSLNQLFKHQLQVLLVNFEQKDNSLKKIAAVYSNTKKRRPSFNLPSVYKDTVLTTWFSPTVIPHYVFIDKTGVVRAFIRNQDMTADNVRKMLHGEYDHIEMKMDIDYRKPLFSSPALPVNKLLQYAVLIKGQYVGLPHDGGWGTEKDGKRYRQAYFNHTLPALYKSIARKLGFEHKLFLVEADSLKNDLSEKYTYDFLVPVEKADQLYWLMLRDLQTQVPLFYKIEKRQTSCWVIKYYGNEKPADSIRGTRWLNLEQKELELIDHSVSYLCAQLNEHMKTIPLVVDESGYKGKINIKIKMDQVESIRSELKKYNMDLVQETRMIDFFVVKDKK